MTREHGKRKIYFDLWDAFSQGGCPVCTVVAGKIIEMIHESDERAFRETVRSLCTEHVRLFAKRGGEADGRVILEFIAEAGLRIQKTIASSENKSPFQEYLERIIPLKGSDPLRESTRHCIACRVNRQYERTVFKILLASLTDPDFDRSFQESDGLCFSHVMKLARYFPGNPKTSVVLKSQLRRLHDLKDAFSLLYTGKENAPLKEDREIVEQARLFLTGQMEAFGEAPELSAEDANDSILQDSLEDGGVTADADLGDPTFEKEKMQRIISILRNRLHVESSRAAALHYQCWQAEENNKALQINLMGAKAQVRLLEEHVQRLKEKITNNENIKATLPENEENRE